MLDIAPTTGNSALLIWSHALACICYTWVGEFSKGVEHAERSLQLYDDGGYRNAAQFSPQDPKTVAGVYGSICFWMLGYPDRALQLELEKDAHARQLGLPLIPDTQ